MSNVVASVGDTQLTKSALNYWMQTMFAGDYAEATGQQVPTGLVSEPVNNARCVANLQAGLPASHHSQAHPEPDELFSKCQHLNALIKRQALRYMIAWRSNLNIDATMGVHITDAEVKRHFESSRYELFAKRHDLERFLNMRRWSLAVELLLVKGDLLSERLYRRLRETVSRAKLAQFYKAQTKRWIAKTTCRPAYVVLGCREYKPGEQRTDISAETLSEEIAKLKEG